METLVSNSTPISRNHGCDNGYGLVVSKVEWDTIRGQPHATRNAGQS
jgi:hypothetical protein